jgi:uncharacterized protein (DUF111 family)
VQFKPLEDYLKILDKVTKQDNFPVFIATDDQRIIEEIKNISPERRIYHFIFPEKNGFDMAKFSELSQEQQRHHIIQLLAEIEMLVEADLFIGTYSSNIGMFVGMARNGKEIYGVDADEWKTHEIN